MKRIPFLVLLVLSLVSCESVYFYGQAVTGQLGILNKRRDIDRLISDENTDAGLRRQLELILSVREFAENELHLPLDDNFSTYADIRRPFVVWNVFATPELSVTQKQWCYPIAGCVTYRGYFSEAAAKKYARKLSDDGYDVYVGGVVAYSTLGWFSDPVLNTVINREDYRLVSLIFHELAHQLAYIPGDTEFNESFATAVELEGLSRWLEQTQDNTRASELVGQANLEKERRREFASLVQDYVARLDAMYQSSMGDDEKRRNKQNLLDQLRMDYSNLKQAWKGYDAYDGWFSQDLNNAQLGTVATYFNRVPAFEKMLADTGHDLPEFYNRIEVLTLLSKEDRNRELDSWQSP